MGNSKPPGTSVWRQVLSSQNQHISMLSNFSASYNVVTISVILPILRLILALSSSTNDESQANLLKEESECASAVIMGMMIGQIFGGTLGDILGVQRAIFLVMIIQIVSSLSSSFASLHANETIDHGTIFNGENIKEPIGIPRLLLSSIPAMIILLKQLTFWRFWLGVGCGGVYPLAAVLSSNQQDGNVSSVNKVEGNDEYEDEEMDDNREDEGLMDPHTLESNHTLQKTRDRDIDETIKKLKTTPIKRRVKTVLSSESESGNNETDTDAREASKKNQIFKLQSLAFTFSTQGLAFMTVPSFTYILLRVFFPSQDSQSFINQDTVHQLDLIWRTISGCGSIPGITLMIYLFLYSLRDSTTLGISRRNETLFTRFYYFLFGWKRNRSRDLDARESTIMTSSSSSNNLTESSEPLVSSQPEESATVRNTKSKNGIWQSIRSEENLMKKMLGTAGTWFLFDVVFYGNTLFQQLILEVAFNQDGTAATHAHLRALLQESGTVLRSESQPTLGSLMKTTRDSSILSLLSLPGYLCTVFLLGKVTCRTIHQTPKFIQIQGFVWMSVLYGALGIWWNKLTQHQALLILLYGGTFFFSNYGPNSITFMLPSLTFSEDCRSTLNGICAACGKVGALVGASLFQPLSEKLGPETVMLFCAFLSVVALIVTVICV